jgi:hypothetical protein
MSIKTKAQLKAGTDAVIKVNGNREITPPLDNSLRTDVIDSMLNIADGGNVLGALTGYTTELTPTDNKHLTPKKYVDDTFIDQSGAKVYAVASGTDTYTASLTPAITSYAAGQSFKIKFTNANTGASTVNINSLGVKDIKKRDGTAVASGDIPAGSIQELVYNGTYFQIIGDGGGGSVDPYSITITTSVSITAATTDGSGIGQDGKNVFIDNGSNVINYTINGPLTTSFIKHGTGAITFVQGSGRTMIQVNGTAVLSGAVGSSATITSIGTTDYLRISNA